MEFLIAFLIEFPPWNESFFSTFPYCENNVAYSYLYSHLLLIIVWKWIKFEAMIQRFCHVSQICICTLLVLTAIRLTFYFTVIFWSKNYWLQIISQRTVNRSQQRSFHSVLWNDFQQKLFYEFLEWICVLFNKTMLQKMRNIIKDIFLPVFVLWIIVYEVQSFRKINLIIVDGLMWHSL